MKRYWQILKRYRVSLLLSPFLVLITVFSETVQPYFMARIIDDGVALGDISFITRVGAYMIGISIVGLAVNIINMYVSSRTSVGFGTDLRAALFGKIEKLAFPDIDRFGSASLITRLTNDITRIQQVILMSMRIMLRAPMMLVMAIFFVTRINGEMAFIILAALPVLGVCVYVIMRKGFPYFLKVQQKIDALNAVVRENLINIRVVKSFVREGLETKKFTRSSEDLRDMVVKASDIIVTVFPVMQLVLNLSIMAILWFGGGKVMSGELKIGELVSFVNYLTQVLMSLMMLSMVIMTTARASASSQRIVEVLDTEPSLTNTPEGLEDNHKLERGDVEFRDVSFRYTGGENDLLSGISFHAQEGETIAVVGATGSAKSSMMQLIPRLYDVTGGEVMVGGVNVRDYNLDELRRGVGMVLQENVLFSGTILDNLRWGDQNAGMEEVIAACKSAQAHDFITSFDKGYDTVLERGGVNLSGGQRQRLCIARALLRKPKVLILDDSTSAVDTETELKIRTGLTELLSGTTVFIITQRINTMQSADRVIVLDNGRIESMGTPGELMESSDIYREIYKSQEIIL